MGGNCRSVALSFLLKYHYGVDAIAMGIDGNNDDTIKMLCEWADHIFILQGGYEVGIPKEYHSKISFYDVGEDRFFQINQELLGILNAMASHHIKKGIIGNKGVVMKHRPGENAIAIGETVKDGPAGETVKPT